MINPHDDITRFDLLNPGIFTAPTVVEDCEDAWNELSPTGCTITAGTTNKVVGTNCVKIAMAANAAAGIIASEAISPAKDLSGMKYISLHIMCTRGINAGDLQLALDDTAECASPVKLLNIPAIKSGVMNWVVLALGEAAAGQDAIASIGLKMVTDLGACDIYIDQVEAWSGEPLNGVGVDMLDYDGVANLVLSVSAINAGSTKTLDVAIQESDYPYSGFAAKSPAFAFTQVTESPGVEEKQIDVSGSKRYIRAVCTMGSADCSYSLALHGYGVKKYRGY